MLALYGHLFSSYTWKALIALYANGTEFEFRALDAEHPENFEFVARAHPAGKFPVLTDGGVTVVEATAIIEYLAVHRPGPQSLIPVEPALAATARMLDRVFDNYVMANMQRVVAAHFKDRDNPGLGLRDQPEAAEAGPKSRSHSRRVRTGRDGGSTEGIGTYWTLWRRSRRVTNACRIGTSHQ